ncbi:hypothetical protein AHAS_Ahas17G0139300 [Arachis hypogaea]
MEGSGIKATAPKAEPGMDFSTRLVEEGGTNGFELPKFKIAYACKPNVSASNPSKALPGVKSKR